MNEKTDLVGKKLLMIGGGAYFNHIKQYQNETGFRIIAVGNDTKAEYYQGADEAYQISTADIEGITNLVKQKRIDGLFAGANEHNVSSAALISEKTDARFYTTCKQWEQLSDKARFKEICRQYGVPVVPEYKVSTEEDINHLSYPVIIKPVDSSGAHGINVCYRKNDFMRLYDQALEQSKKGEVIVEKYIEYAEEVFFEYTIQDGRCSLTAAFSKERASRNDSINSTLPIFHFFPSKRLDEYYVLLNDSILKMFEGLSIKNGVMTIQSFYTDDKFYVFEAGYRMGGAQNYILSRWENGANSLNYMINYVLTGYMSSIDISEIDNAFFKYPCCNYYVGLKAGTIGEMPSKEYLEMLPGVLNATIMRKPGDIIEDTNALDRICIRLHVKGNSKDELARNLVKICSSIKVVSTDGDDMKIEELRYDRCRKSIEQSVWKSIR